MNAPYFVVDEHGCWIWHGNVRPDGYGSIMRRPRNFLAHRWVWSQLRGHLSSETHLHHVCEVPLCVNPEHLLPLTHAEHARAHEQTRSVCGLGHAWTPENTYRYANGKRRCRACHRDQEARRKLRRAKAAA